MKVKEIMYKPQIITEDINLKKAGELIIKKNLECLLLIKNNKILGIVTKTDLVKNFGKNLKISEIMNKNVILENYNSNLDDAVQIMKDNNISVLPIVNDKKILVGMVDDTYILRKLFETEDFLLD